MRQELERYLDLLTQCEMFRGIEGEKLMEMLGTMRSRVVEYAKGETIYRFGDNLREFALLLEGVVMVESSDPEGDDVNLNMLRSGDEFGAFMMISGNTRSMMHFYAGTRCAVLMFDPRRVMDSRTRDEDTWRLMNNMLVNFAEKCVYLYQKVQIYGKKRIRSRIRLYLMTLDMVDDAVTLPMNRTDLAAYLGVDRTALARELGRMQQEGLIAVNKRRVRILDRDFFHQGQEIN